MHPTKIYMYLQSNSSILGYTGIIMPNGPEYSLTLSTPSYSAENYSIIFYFTDVYGQSSQKRLFLRLRGIQV